MTKDKLILELLTRTVPESRKQVRIDLENLTENKMLEIYNILCEKELSEISSITFNKNGITVSIVTGVTYLL